MNYSCCVAFTKRTSSFNYLIEQFSSITIFCDEVKPLRVLIAADKLDYVRVVNLTKNVQLLRQHFIIFLINLTFLDALHSNSDLLIGVWLRNSNHSELA